MLDQKMPKLGHEIDLRRASIHDPRFIQIEHLNQKDTDIRSDLSPNGHGSIFFPNRRLA
jgi:hypothetical protein